MITQDSILLIKNKKVSIPDLVENYGATDIEEAIDIANILVKQGNATVYEHKTEQQEMISKARKAIVNEEFVNLVEQEEEQEEARKREKRNADQDKFTITLEFGTYQKALIAEKRINDEFKIQDTEVITIHGVPKVRVKGITHEEYAKISRAYSLDNSVEAVINGTKNITEKATNAINYANTNVVAPAAKIVAEAGMNVGKGLLHTALKTGASLVNAGVKAGKETKESLQTDTEMIKAQAQLRGAKNAFCRLLAGKNKIGGGKGITIE